MTRTLNRQLIQCGAIFLVLAVVPLTVSSQPWLDLAIMTGYYLLLAGSWNLLAGFTGQYSFAHLGLAALGAYASALLNRDLGIPVIWTFPLAGLIAGLAGLGLGVVSLRVKGVALPLITFGFAGAFGVWLKAARSVTQGSNGLFTTGLFSGTRLQPYLWVALGLCLLYFVLQSLILSSRWGLYLTAVRDNEAIAEGVGVNTFTAKLIAFSYTAMWAGIAGAFYAAYQGIISPVMMDLSEMGLVVVMVVVGGMGRPLAVIAGVILIQVLSYWTRGFGGQYTLLITAGISLPIVLFTRDGLVGLIADVLRSRFGARQSRWADESPTPAAQKAGGA